MIKTRSTQSFKVISLFTVTSNGEKTLYFNVSEMKHSIQDYRLLSQAKLRLYVKDPTIQPGLPQRLAIYQGLGSTTKYLGFHDISNELRNKWISIDVTATLKEWLQLPGKLFSISSILLSMPYRLVKEAVFEIFMKNSLMHVKFPKKTCRQPTTCQVQLPQLILCHSNTFFFCG